MNKENAVNVIQKGTWAYNFVEGYKYVIKIGGKGQTTAVNILNHADVGKLTQNWVLRVDKPHPKYEFPHLNLRHKYSGIRDPHLKLPPGSVTVAQSAGYFAKIMNQFSKLSFIFDGIFLIKAVAKDAEEGIANNTIECVTTCVSSRLGGLIGAACGGFVGTLIFPVLGTISFAIIGALVFAYYAQLYSNLLVKSHITNKRVEIPNFPRFYSKL